MSKYIVVKLNNGNLVLVEQDLSLEEAKKLISNKTNPNEYLILEDFNGIVL